MCRGPDGETLEPRKVMIDSVNDQLGWQGQVMARTTSLVDSALSVWVSRS